MKIKMPFRVYYYIHSVQVRACSGYSIAYDVMLPSNAVCLQFRLVYDEQRTKIPTKHKNPVEKHCNHCILYETPLLPSPWYMTCPHNKTLGERG